MNKYKRNNTIIVIIVAIFLLLVSSLIYNLYFKDYGEYNKTEEKKESIFIDINDENIINELLNTIDTSNLKDIAAFEKNIDNINTLEPVEKINIAYNSIKNEEKKEIDTIEIDNYFKKTFKTTIYWDKADIFCINGEVLYKYDISSNKYIYNIEHNCENHYEITPIFTKVINAKKKNNIYVLTVSFIWNNNENIDAVYSSYKDALSKENILLVIPSEDGNPSNEIINNFIINSYDSIKDKLHKYTFIFEKENSNYLLSRFSFSE